MAGNKKSFGWQRLCFQSVTVSVAGKESEPPAVARMIQCFRQDQLSIGNDDHQYRTRVWRLAIVCDLRTQRPFERPLLQLINKGT